jgi:hypothetical protein
MNSKTHARVAEILLTTLMKLVDPIRRFVRKNKPIEVSFKNSTPEQEYGFHLSVTGVVFTLDPWEGLAPKVSSENVS